MNSVSNSNEIDDVGAPGLRRSGSRDRGSVLPMVLVFMVIGSLVILPLLSYSSTVFRHNQVVSRRTAESEAARGGLRMALADPVETYEQCGHAGRNDSSAVTLPGPGMTIGTTTTCNLLDIASAKDNSSVPFSVAHTWLGEPVVSNGAYAPPSPEQGIVGIPYDNPAPVDESDWLDQATSDGKPVENPGDPDNPLRRIWSPDLPVHSLTLRSPLAYDMPPGYPFAGYTTCNVYFPGTYRQPVTISGPTYFASGVYYFEDEVRVVANTAAGGEPTTVIAGQGTLEGCVDDQYAVFYALDAPAGHNVSALGATFVFGDDGRLVIDDSAGPVTFRMNQRYVKDDDEANLPSEGISIMTVNGVVDADTSAFESLSIPGSMAVPKSLVGGTEAHREAVADQYLPSILTPAPRAPTPPRNVTANDRSNGVVVAWDAPGTDGGDLIQRYRARIVDSSGNPTGQYCETTETMSCAITGLSNWTNYRVNVVAINAIGTSEPSDTATFRPDTGDSSFALPQAPTGVTIVKADADITGKISKHVDAFEVTVQTPGNTGNAPINAYQVEVTATIGLLGSRTYTCETVGSPTCVVAITDSLLSLLLSPTFDIRARAQNAQGWGNWQSVTGFTVDLLGTPYTPPAPVVASRYEPPAVVEVASTSTHRLEVHIPGYIAAPQGVVAVSTVNPADKHVALSGGVLAAWSSLAEPKPADFVYGLLNPATQRLVRIRTTVAGSHVSAEAIVQINETGAWAVNSWMVQ